MRRKLIILASLMLVFLSAQAKNTYKMLEGEKWWGCVTDLGVQMPFDNNTKLEFDLSKQNFNNQTTPLFVSNKGRYIWCDGSFRCTIQDGEITIDPIRGEVECVQAGSTLKEAFLAASARHFPPSGVIPPKEFLNVPQYNTWIELV